jgi:hypothetical protein
MFVLILRSAHAQALPQSRTSVRASRRMRTATGRRPHASRRIAAHSGCGSACARRAAMLLSMRGEGAPRIVGRTKPSEHQPAAARKHRRPRSVVSGCYLQWLAQLQRVEPSARGPVGGQRGHGEMGALTPLHARAARRARCDDPRSPPVCRNRARPAAECRESRPPCSRW